MDKKLPSSQKINIISQLLETLDGNNVFRITDLPKAWVLCLLEDTINIVGGSQPPKKVFLNQKTEGYVRLVQIRDYKSNKFLTYIPQNSTKKFCTKEDIMIGRYGPPVFQILRGLEGAYNVALMKATPLKTIHKEFMYYMLKSSPLQNFVISNSQRTAGQSGVNLKLLNKAVLPLPPVAEQKRIVAKLDVLMAHIERSKERLAKVPDLMKAFRQSVLAQAVSGKLTEDWREGKVLESAEDLLHRISATRKKTYEDASIKAKLEKKRKPRKPILSIESDISIDIDIPKSWLKCHIGDIGDVTNGSTPSRKIISYWLGDIPWVSSGLVQNNRINKTKEYITKQGFNNSSVTLLPVGTVLIAMIGEGKTRGQSAILDIKATTNQNIAGINISHGYIVSEYLQFWFIYRYEVNRLAGAGSGPKALNGQKVRELDFVLAPLQEQKEIVKQIEALFSKADAIEAQYKAAMQHLETLPQAVLAKAFRGELVEQHEQDEPASVLLKRIQAEQAALELGKTKGKKKRKKV